MRILQEGLTGDDVKAWQKYLVSQGYSIATDGGFGHETKVATAAFQQKYGLSVDGEVGNSTLMCAVQHGFNAGTQQPATNAASGGVPFRWAAAPTADDADHIKILDGWIEANIVTFLCPYIGTGVHMTLNKAIVDDFQAWMKAVHDAGLMSHLLPFCGGFNPRYKRGMPHDQDPRHVSNHASGHATDWSAARLPLGSHAAPNDPIRDIVPIAKEHGFRWGGDYVHRPDPMHFDSVHSPFP